MIDLSFRIAIEPEAKARPRARVIRKKDGTYTATVYTPNKTSKYEKAVALLAAPHRPPERLTGPIAVTMTIDHARPEYMCKRSKRTGALLGGYSAGPTLKATKPDIDNLAKAVLDALKSWWCDDAQVVHLVATKRYCAIDGEPGIGLRIRTVPESAA